MKGAQNNITEPVLAILVNSLESGGAEKQSVYLLNVLKDKYKTLFFIFHGDLIDEKIFRLIEGDNYVLVQLRGNFFLKLVNLYRVLKDNNVKVFFTYLTKPNFWGSIIGSLAGVKKIYGGIRSTNLPIWKLILEIITMHFLSTGTIFNSYLAEEIFSKGLKAKHSIVIPNCLPFISNASIRTPKECLTIISVGRFHEAKDYKTAINAINLLVKKELKIYYQIIGYGHLESSIRKWITELHLNESIELIINPSNIIELLEKADIYLSTSKYEGTSNSIMEAMNSSLPIVATNVGDNNKLIFEGKSGYLHDVGDFKSIADRLQFLIQNYEARINMGIKSNEILRENYSSNQFRDRYFKLIQTK